MPKIKTRKTLLKRIKITKRGKVMRKFSRIGHLKEKSDSSTKSRKKNLRRLTNIGQIRVFRKLLAKRGRGVN
jgi:ribosomal protein L35